MGAQDVEDLLTPSVGAAPRAPLFSVNALIAAAFFGGVFAAPLIALENARRLGRLRRDALVLGLALVVAAVAVLLLFSMLGPDPADSRTQVRMLHRAAGFALAGGCYWLHRNAYRTQRMLGIDPASPWIAVIAAVLVSLFLTILLGSIALFVSGEGVP